MRLRESNIKKYKAAETSTQTEHFVTVISYDGEYPNLCAGDLVMSIDGIEYSFPRYCLRSGGTCSASNDWNPTEGPWSICEWPPDPIFKDEKIRSTVLDVVNNVIPHGCCGGCA